MAAKTRSPLYGRDPGPAYKGPGGSMVLDAIALMLFEPNFEAFFKYKTSYKNIVDQNFKWRAPVAPPPGSATANHFDSTFWPLLGQEEYQSRQGSCELLGGALNDSLNVLGLVELCEIFLLTDFTFKQDFAFLMIFIKW